MMLSRFRALYRERRAVRWTVDALALLAIFLLISAYQTRKHLRGPMPALQLRATSGETVALDSLRGKKTLVYVWAPWCGVCKVESSNVSRVRSLVGGRANVVSIVAGYQSADEVQRHVATHSIDYPVLLGDEHALAVTSFPTIYFLDEQGRITRSVTGYTTTAGLLARLFMP